MCQNDVVKIGSTILPRENASGTEIKQFEVDLFSVSIVTNAMC
jgi:hypothetical protein